MMRILAAVPIICASRQHSLHSHRLTVVPILSVLSVTGLVDLLVAV